MIMSLPTRTRLKKFLKRFIKLEVIINDKVINSKTIKKYITNKKYYIQQVEDLKDEFTPLYFDTYTRIKPIKLEYIFFFLIILSNLQLIPSAA